jgi:hypothetical protein
MLQLPEPLFEAVGGIHIGGDFINSFQASRPFGKIEVYQDRVVLKIENVSDQGLGMFRLLGKIPFIPGTYKDIPREIDLPFELIKGYKKINLGPLGHGITFLHSEQTIPPFLQIWLRKKDWKKVIESLNNSISNGRS